MHFATEEVVKNSEKCKFNYKHHLLQNRPADSRIATGGLTRDQSCKQNYYVVRNATCACSRYSEIISYFS